MTKQRRKMRDKEWKAVQINKPYNYIETVVRNAKFYGSSKRGQIEMSWKELDNYATLTVVKDHKTIIEFGIKDCNHVSVNYVDEFSYYKVRLINSIYKSLTFTEWLNLEWDKASRKAYLDYARPGFEKRCKVLDRVKEKLVGVI